MTRWTRWMGAVVWSLVVGSPVFAQTTAGAAEDDQWHFSFAPWLWGAGLSGTVSVLGSPEVPIDMSFGDALDDLDFGIQGHFEAQRHRIGFGVDFLYLDLGVPVAEERPVLGRTDLEVQVREAIGEAFGFYRFGEAARTHVDVLVGMRYFGTSTRIAGNEFEGTKRSLDWVDGMFGARVIVPIGRKFSLTGRADVATFGSDITWNLNSDVRWHISNHWAVGAGYRYLDIDYDNDEVIYKPTMEGPYAGFAFSW